MPPTCIEQGVVPVRHVAVRYAVKFVRPIEPVLRQALSFNTDGDLVTQALTATSEFLSCIAVQGMKGPSSIIAVPAFEYGNASFGGPF